MTKKAFCLIFAFLFSINSFAAIVSDNDGAAFVTKAEFEAMKENFASQVTNYNTSIDSKIDGAIASYLAGTRMSNKETVKLDNTFNWSFPIICMNNSEWNDKDSKYYSYELPKYDTVEMTLRAGSDARDATVLDWNSTAINSTNIKSDYKAVGFAKQWHEMKEIYNEMIELSDTNILRSVGGSSLKCYQLKNIGKGRHRVQGFRLIGAKDAGHILSRSTPAYWGYSGVMGLGYDGASTYRNNITTGTFSHWTFATWSRTYGNSAFSSLGWGWQGNNAFALPANGLDLNGARLWAATYTAVNETYAHGQASITGYTDEKGFTSSIIWKDDKNNNRSWIFTGNTDAPATSSYGWYFNFKKPNSALEKFEGYVMKYDNDLVLATIQDGNWAGFHSWSPIWYWKYVAGGTIGTKPSESQFSKLPAKQVYYYDTENNIHYMDEGLFLFNMPGTPESVEFDAKWEVLDSSITTQQKIQLKISSTPFDATHDNSKNLKYTVDGGSEGDNQQIVCGSSKKIKVACDESVKQLYMMWTPVTSGTYLGLKELSDFTVEVEQ